MVEAEKFVQGELPNVLYTQLISKYAVADVYEFYVDVRVTLWFANSSAEKRSKVF